MNSVVSRDSASLSSFPLSSLSWCSLGTFPLQLHSALNITISYTWKQWSALRITVEAGGRINPLYDPKCFKVIPELSSCWLNGSLAGPLSTWPSTLCKCLLVCFNREPPQQQKLHNVCLQCWFLSLTTWHRFALQMSDNITETIPERIDHFVKFCKEICLLQETQVSL